MSDQTGKMAALIVAAFMIVAGILLLAASLGYANPTNYSPPYGISIGIVMLILGTALFLMGIFVIGFAVTKMSNDGN
jgi:hypothetical protein